MNKEEVKNFLEYMQDKVQEQANIVEVLDKNKQPINKLCDISIEIDNSIEKDYEVVR